MDVGVSSMRCTDSRSPLTASAFSREGRCNWYVAMAQKCARLPACGSRSASTRVSISSNPCTPDQQSPPLGQFVGRKACCDRRQNPRGVRRALPGGGGGKKGRGGGGGGGGWGATRPPHDHRPPSGGRGAPAQQTPPTH